MSMEKINKIYVGRISSQTGKKDLEALPPR